MLKPQNEQRNGYGFFSLEKNSNSPISYRPFRNAIRFARRLGLKNEKEWREYCKSGKKPKEILSYLGISIIKLPFWIQKIHSEINKEIPTLTSTVDILPVLAKLDEKLVAAEEKKSLKAVNAYVTF